VAFQPVRGISADHVTNIPKEWSKEWFRGFIRNHMEQMDVRNAVAGPGISIASDAAKPSHTLLARAIISTGAGGPAFPNQSANQVLAGPPSGAPGSPTFRAIVPADIQTISPTWTGNHVFSPATGVAVTINAASGATGLAANGAADQFAIFATGSSSSGHSFGLSVRGGTTSGDEAIRVANQAGSTGFLRIFGDGHGIIGPDFIAGLGISWTIAGNVTIAAPSSGDALTVTGGGTGNYAARFLGANTAGSRGVEIRGGTANSADFALIIRDAAATNNLFTLQANGGFGLGVAAGTLNGSSAGNVTIAAPSSGDTLTATAVSGGNALVTVGTAAGTAVMRANTQATTGTKTATMSGAANNKPGTNNQTDPAKWLPYNFDGTTYYIPAYAA
jgi:hypothetical protein